MKYRALVSIFGFLLSSLVIAQTTARPEFAVISIRPAPPSLGPFGLACRGADGPLYARWGNFAGVEDPSSYPIKPPQGRCVGSSVSLRSLMELAYDASGFVIGGPDWVRGISSGQGITNNFHVEGAADNPSTATIEDLRRMLQATLADRFKLKFHREPREGQGYGLHVAKGGLKIQEVPRSEKSSPFSFINGNRKAAVKGKSTLAEFVAFLHVHDFTAGDSLFVVDKTDLKGIYDYEFVMPVPGGGGQRGAAAGGGGLPSASDEADRLSSALESQLGLRLQLEKVSVEMLVIDAAEKPSPN